MSIGASCAGAAPEAIGSSHTPGSMPPEPSASASAPPPSSPLPTDFRASFTKLNRARFASRGHLRDRFDVDVYANAAGKAAWESGAREVPVGAVFAKEQFDRAISGDRAAGVLAMEKREAGYDPEGGDWRWIVLRAGGAIEEEGKIEACGRCHAQAPGDHLFSFVE